METGGNWWVQQQILILAPICGIAVETRPETIPNLNRRMLANFGHRCQASIHYTDYPSSLANVEMGQEHARKRIRKLTSTENVRQSYLGNMLVVDKHFRPVEPVLAAYIVCTTWSMLDGC